jgi:hypothetical protein
MISLALGMATYCGGFVIGGFANSEMLFWIGIVVGGMIVFATVIPLWTVAEFVRCPQCGRPFNRHEYRHWYSWFFAKTTPRWSCLHCGYDGSE